MDKKPDPTPPDNHVDPEHAPRGVPPGATEEEAMGQPSDRQATETAGSKPD